MLKVYWSIYCRKKKMLENDSANIECVGSKKKMSHCLIPPRKSLWCRLLCAPLSISRPSIPAATSLSSCGGGAPITDRRVILSCLGISMPMMVASCFATSIATKSIVSFLLPSSSSILHARIRETKNCTAM